MSASSNSSALGAALREYLDARGSALLTARKTLGINELDARALLHIAANPGTKPSALRSIFGLTSAGASVLIDRLVGREAVRREPDPEDGRSVRLHAVIDFAAEPWSELTRFDTGLESALAELDREEADRVAQFIRDLTRRAVGG